MLETARFYKTINHLNDLPQDEGGLSKAKVLFAGRSNAGKSSVLNKLCQKRRLAFSSRTPGRTQYINYFLVGSESAPAGYLVDLPGYGYAQVPIAIKQHWQKLLEGYLRKQEGIRALILVVDIRRRLSEADEQMIHWSFKPGRPIHILLNKADKLGRAQQLLAVKDVEQRVRAFGWPELTVQLFSATQGLGLAEAKKKIEAWLNA